MIPSLPRTPSAQPEVAAATGPAGARAFARSPDPARMVVVLMALVAAGLQGFVLTRPGALSVARRGGAVESLGAASGARGAQHE